MSLSFFLYRTLQTVAIFFGCVAASPFILNIGVSVAIGVGDKIVKILKK